MNRFMRLVACILIGVALIAVLSRPEVVSMLVAQLAKPEASSSLSAPSSKPEASSFLSASSAGPASPSAKTDTVASFAALQTELDAAMHSRSTSFSVSYTGQLADNSAFETGLRTALDNIRAADDYLAYSIKSIDYSYSYAPSSRAARVTFDMDYWTSAPQEDYVTGRVTDILGQIIIPGMNEFQKEKAIHDWVVANVAYDSTLDQHSDYAALVAPNRTVCQGYTLLTSKMLSQAGITNRIAEGAARGGNHSWNEVLLGGVWYHLDTTFDDPVPDVPGRILYDYYNLTDAQISRDHTWTKSYPEASTSFADGLAAEIAADPGNTAVYQGISDAIGLQYLTPRGTANNRAELTARVKQAIQNRQTSFKVRYTSGSTAAADLQAAIAGSGSIASLDYVKTDFPRSPEPDDILLEVHVTYVTQIRADSVSLSQTASTVVAGRSTITLMATILPENASNKRVIWSSSDPTVATVNNGVVTPVGTGTVTITATAVDGGKSAFATFAVVAP